jgi:hypothetical protein
MSWHDPVRAAEPAAETALRDELRGLLGMAARPANYFETEPSPTLVRLADDLRREALRRNHTARRGGSWMLLAAAAPFLLSAVGLGAWGVTEKHKVDQLAGAVLHQQEEIQRLAAAAAQPQGAPAVQTKAPADKLQSAQPLLVGARSPKVKPKELVIPVERSSDQTVTDTQRVRHTE